MYDPEVSIANTTDTTTSAAPAVVSSAAPGNSSTGVPATPVNIADMISVTYTVVNQIVSIYCYFNCP